jgi:hypothetical protein
MPKTQTLPKVVLVGFNKCATRSFANLFAAAGHPSVHHKIRSLFRSVNLAKVVQQNLQAGKKAFDSIDGYTLYGDLIYQSETECFEAYLHFREILRDYPGTILLLNLRDREDWIRSRANHGHGEFMARTMRANGFNTAEECKDYWRRQWDSHIQDVRTYMAEFPGQLIEFNIDTDNISQLVEALPAYKLQALAWKDQGRSRSRNHNSLLNRLKKAWSHIRPRSY